MNDKKPQGVAQRVFRDLYDADIRAAHGDGDQVVTVARWKGAEYMHTEISREARAILAEWDNHFHRLQVNPDPELSEDELDDITTEVGEGRDAICYAFTRLGLDLEVEDTK